MMLLPLPLVASRLRREGGVDPLTRTMTTLLKRAMVLDR